MNIFKKIKLANTLLKAYNEIKDYLDNNHITEETKADIEAIKSACERLANRIPEYKQLYEMVKGLIK